MTASRPGRSKLHQTSQKWIPISFAMSVENYFRQKTHSHNTTGLFTQKWSLLALRVIKHSEAKRNWHITWGQHMLKRKLSTVSSNLEKLNAVIFLHQRATWEDTRREHMRKLKMPIPQSFFVICVITAQLWRLTWSDTIKLARTPWSQIPLKTLATCATKRFQQRRSCKNTQNCTTKKRLAHRIVRFLVLSVRKHLQRNPTWRGIRRITMDSQRGAMLFKIVQGLRYSQQKPLLKTLWLKEQQQNKFFVISVISVTSNPRKKGILRDTC